MGHRYRSIFDILILRPRDTSFVKLRFNLRSKQSLISNFTICQCPCFLWIFIKLVVPIFIKNNLIVVTTKVIEFVVGFSDLDSDWQIG
ncbi:hypothetical protein IX335_001873 [Porphyromonas levii]|nr:hypothetical protein [Porphyromonas levii]